MALPDRQLLDAVARLAGVDRLPAAMDLLRDAGDLARPPWPAWLLETIETGGDGYCLHATMRQARTGALLHRSQTLARRNQRDQPRTRDVVHFDMNPRSKADRCT